MIQFSSNYIPVSTTTEPPYSNTQHLIMSPQPVDAKFKILMAAMSQFSDNKKDFLPPPNYHKLAEQLGLPSYASAQGVWKRLTDELKVGTKGDLKIRDPEAEKKKKTAESPVKKQAAEESDAMADDSESSPTKRSKVNASRRAV